MFSLRLRQLSIRIYRAKFISVRQCNRHAAEQQDCKSRINHPRDAISQDTLQDTRQHRADRCTNQEEQIQKRIDSCIILCAEYCGSQKRRKHSRQAHRKPEEHTVSPRKIHVEL